MMFVLSATRTSTRRARLRHYLLLVCRCLAILFLVLAMSRPIAGGRLTSAFARAPDTVIMLLDRSASMEMLDPAANVPKRTLVVDWFTRLGQPLTGLSRFVLIESASRAPLEIASPAALKNMAAVRPTDTAADIPAMLTAAADYIVDNRCGRSEIWIGSDLQVSNWHPDAGEWQHVAERLAALPQDVSVLIVSLAQTADTDTVLSVREAARRRTAGEDFVDLAFSLRRAARIASGPIPLTLSLDGISRMLEVAMDSETIHTRARLNIQPGKVSAGWGKLEMPPDDNPANNVAFFIYEQAMTLRTVVAVEDAAAAKRLAAAAAPAPERFNRSAVIVPPRELDKTDLSQAALVIWQAAEIDPGTTAALRSFVLAGGAVFCFPTGQEGQAPLLDAEWGELVHAPPDRQFSVAWWDEQEDILARTADGRPLPLNRLSFVRKRRIIVPHRATAVSVRGAVADAPVWHAAANFDDGEALLVQCRFGAGFVFMCATLPDPAWSNLSESPVLVPMIQRAVEIGSRRFSYAQSEVCGAWRPRPGDDWTAVNTRGEGDCLINAGVYRMGERLVALNRPAEEDMPTTADKAELPRLFGKVPVHVMEAGAVRREQDVRVELSPLFIVFALLCMMAEHGLLSSEATSETVGRFYRASGASEGDRPENAP